MTGHKKRYWLVRLRRGQRLSTTEAADRLGIDVSTYSLIENGKRQAQLRQDTMTKISRVFGVTLDYIAEQEERL